MAGDVMEEKYSLLLTKEEFDLFRTVLFLEPGLQDVTESMRIAANGCLVTFSVVNVNEALDALLYAAGSIAKSVIEKEAYVGLHDKIKEGFYRNKHLRRSYPDE